VIVGAALAALIATFGSVSGAHFNPAVTAADVVFGGMTARVGAAYAAAQVAGAVVGVAGANALFGLPALTIATTSRTGFGLAASEAVATFGLLVVIFGVVRSGNARAVPATVGAWIAAAIYCTSSASFANPAVTLARTLTDTYTGIAPGALPGFVLAQALGTAGAVAVIVWLFSPDPVHARQVVVPHEPADGGGQP
jgi:arsenate reductase